MSSRRPVPRPVRERFWERIRAGLGVTEADRVAGMSHEVRRVIYTTNLAFSIDFDGRIPTP